ncbi:phosphoribosylformylglycinamidine cyclo-ligase [Thermosulfidibacter takaii ABI70S6]|uniref:Phosphoribosylformylglycinamidine cyclo-ligase n=1 Tax=Thermosulfidibacter takaii (strain DSM 17441 / JCM 13301 / NBRC 103674 / ABI70S6) TaxID=1298851 RepID=A0A0S3QRA8_THET7|nr:phosphoribosylformylglycinamidine cyclo-ligase [Thermosulfidibacter takaii ABI70S6]
MRYKDAGVDIDKADSLVEVVKQLASKTFSNNILQGVGGYAGVFQIQGYKNPVFGASTDGVGTKLKIAFMMNKHDTVGIDLVAMSANDLITTGLEPMIFLDYYACGKLEEKTYIEVMKGIVKGCEEAECALIGGETAEMPDFYPPGEYDLAGFCVGVCEEEDLITPNLKEQDIVIGVASSGLHSNGYSLSRKVIFEKTKMNPDTYIEELGKTIGDELLTPTRIYVKTVKALKKSGIKPKGIAHITGGGLLEKPKRLLKEDLSLCLYTDSWTPQPIFNLLQKWGDIPKEEMFRTFNMGLGLLVVVDKDEADRALETLKKAGEKAYFVGEVIKGKGEVKLWEGRF